MEDLYDMVAKHAPMEGIVTVLVGIEANIPIWIELAYNAYAPVFDT